MIKLAPALLAVFVLTAPAQAQTGAPTPSDTVALTPEQREAALEAGAVRARDESLQNGTDDRRVHGEMGVEVGSRGERAAYGTLVAPIGQNGVAAISYGTGQGPRWHGHRGRFRDTSVSASYSNDGAAPPAQNLPAAENINPD